MDGTAWWTAPVSGPTCGAMIGSRLVASVSDQPYTTGSYALAITPQLGSALVTAFLAGDPNTPGDTGLGVAGPGYVALASLDFGANETTQLGRAVGTGGTPATYTATYTPGHSPASSVECGCVVALRTSHTTPVQVATGGYNPGSMPSFASSPTAGNTIVLLQGVRGMTPGTTPDPSGLSPVGGWVLLGWAYATHSEPFNMGAAVVWGRCVQAGDGKAYGQVSGSQSMAETILEYQP